MLKKSHSLYLPLRKRAEKIIHYLPKDDKVERLSGYKEFLAVERERIVDYHRKGKSGLYVAHAGAIMMDVLIQCVFRTALLTYSEKHLTLPCECTLVGLGGYGRGEISPSSDIDFMFLYPDDAPKKDTEQLKEILTHELLYPLWDLGLKVGHSSRTIKEAIQESKADVKSRNSLLETRQILGSKKLLNQFNREYRKSLDKSKLGVYLDEMIEVQLKRREQYGGSVFAVEPNIKNGVGGLRDYQGIFWMSNMLYGDHRLETLYDDEVYRKQELKTFRDAYDFLLRIRNELHMVSRRPTDELTLKVQPHIAESLGYQGNALNLVESMMQDYYMHAHNILTIAKSLEKRLTLYSKSEGKSIISRFFNKNQEVEIDGFRFSEGLIDYTNEAIFDDTPEKLIKVFHLSQVTDESFSVNLERLIRQKAELQEPPIWNSPGFTQSFVKILSNTGHVHPTLDEMYTLGVLTRMIPEFETLKNQIRHDRHLTRFATDLRVMGSIKKLDGLLLSHRKGLLDNYLNEVIENTNHIGDIYWMLLLYSIEFPEPSYGPMDEISPDLPVVNSILDRFALEKEQKERILNFIFRHRNVARFWQQALFEDARSITHFLEHIHDVDTLNSSFLFYYCDTWGKNPQYWEIHSFPEIEQLHRNLSSLLSVGNGDPSIIPTAEESRMMLRSEIQAQYLDNIPEEEIDAHFHLLPDRYFASRVMDDVSLHIRLIHELLHSINAADSLGSLKPILDWKDIPQEGQSMLNVVTWDRASLFYKLAGAISSVGLNILRARAISRTDHITIDTFYVTHPKTGVVEDEDLRGQFEEAVEAILVEGNPSGHRVRDQYEKSKFAQGYEKIAQFEISMPVHVEVSHDKNLNQIIIDYQGADRIGLLYQISRQISRAGFNIDSVRVNTHNTIAAGTFYLDLPKKQKESQSHAKIAELREKLIAILSSDSWLDL